MVLLIMIPIFYGYFIGKINPIFRQTQMTWTFGDTRPGYGKTVCDLENDPVEI
jgi:hypothetical protein